MGGVAGLSMYPRWEYICQEVSFLDVKLYYDTMVLQVA